MGRRAALPRPGRVAAASKPLYKDRMPAPWPLTPPTAADRAAYADAEPRPFWLAELPARDPSPPLRGAVEADLCIVGGGFTGLWAALHAKADDPGREVVLLEAETIGFGASGRNGGFAIGSLTHGLENGLARFGDEIELLERLGRENLTGYVADLERHGIDCDYEPTGELTPSVAPYQDDWPAETAELYGRFGYDVEVFADAAAMRAEVDSPLYRGGAWVKDAGGVLDPAKLALGLYEAARRAGVRVYEKTPVESIGEAGGRSGSRPSAGTGGSRTDAPVVVLTPTGTVTARRVVVGTSAYPSPVRSVRRYIAPVYDYALMSEPLAPEQLRAIGWGRRQGIGDGGNRFHYYRLSADDRILGAASTPSTATAARSGPTSMTTTRPSPASPRTSASPSPSSRACASPTAGAARSTPAAASRSSSGRRSAGGSPTPPGTPGSASSRPASGRGSRSTWSTGARPRRPAAATSAASRCRSRPSRCAAA
jgi:glycine/D-amino acid oxidase-like deaminating enzyme